MRLRHIPGNEDFIREAASVVNIPERYRGNWSTFLRKEAPLTLEIGMGKGRFLYEFSAKEPERNFPRLERYASMLQKAIEQKGQEGREQEKRERESPYFLWGDAKCLTEILVPGEAVRIYLNFSDPRPKAGHAVHRLTPPEFLKLYGTMLAPREELWLKTDNDDLFEWSLEEIPVMGWVLQGATRNLHRDVSTEENAITEYEEKFSAWGRKISRPIATWKK